MFITKKSLSRRTFLRGAGVTMALQAAAYIHAGLCDYVLCGMSAAIDGSRPRRPPGPGQTETATSEFAAPFGPTVGANGWYAMIAKRYEKAGSFPTRHWRPDVHVAAFALPTYVREIVEA